MPKKSEEKVKVHKKGNIRSLHIPRLMDGGEGDMGRKSCAVKGIDHKREKKGNNNRTREDGGVCSPMSVTR